MTVTTMPASGPIDMSTLDQVLGRAANATVSLGETATRNLAGVASGPISLSNLYGKSAGSLNNPAGGATNVGTTAGIRSVTMSVNSDGTTSFGGNWWIPTTAGIGSSWYVKFVYNNDVNSAVSAGTVNSWLPLTSSQSITVHNTGAGLEGDGTLEIYFSSTGSDANIAASFPDACNVDVGDAGS